MEIIILVNILVRLTIKEGSFEALIMETEPLAGQRRHCAPMRGQISYLADRTTSKRSEQGRG